jgi:hypothetical protein
VVFMPPKQTSAITLTIGGSRVIAAVPFSVENGREAPGAATGTRLVNDPLSFDRLTVNHLRASETGGSVRIMLDASGGTSLCFLHTSETERWPCRSVRVAAKA